MKRRQAMILCAAAFIFTAAVLVNVSWEKRDSRGGLSEAELGLMCLSGTVAGIEEDKEISSEKKPAAEKNGNKKEKEDDKVKKEKGDPLVIIYHTHATESYQPSSGGNFHKEGEKNTVREVGDVVEDTLEKEGINVIHDKTLHDRPSYNESYARSLETVQRLLKKYPTVKYVIDLHRDAAAYSGNKGVTVDIGKDKVASYSLVIGRGCDNYKSLRKFADEVNRKAESMYKGFGGRIIEKDYKFNQWVCDNHLLLEIGNNQNHIDEVRKTGKYIGKVLIEVIND